MESLKLPIELGMDQAVVSNVLVQKNNNSIEMSYGTVAVCRNGNSRLVKVQYVIAVISSNITVAGRILQTCRNLPMRETVVYSCSFYESGNQQNLIEPYHMAYLKLPFLQTGN